MHEAQSQRWYHDWTVAASLLIAAAFLLVLGIFTIIPHKEAYSPGSGDPIVYWEMVSPNNPHQDANGSGAWFFVGIILLGIILIPVFFSKHRLVVIPLMLLSSGMCYLIVLVLAMSGGDTITLYHLDTVALDRQHYHLTGGDVDSLDMPYSRLLLYNCDSNDMNCYSEQVDMYGGGWHDFDDVSLEYHVTDNRIEVWEDGEMIYAVMPSE